MSQPVGPQTANLTAAQAISHQAMWTVLLTAMQGSTLQQHAQAVMTLSWCGSPSLGPECRQHLIHSRKHRRTKALRTLRAPALPQQSKAAVGLRLHRCMHQKEQSHAVAHHKQPALEHSHLADVAEHCASMVVLMVAQAITMACVECVGRHAVA